MEKKEIMLGFIIKIKQLIQATPNDQELGAKIRELAYKTELLKEVYNKSSDDKQDSVKNFLMDVSHHNTDIQLNPVVVGDLKLYFSARGSDKHYILEYFINMKTGEKTEYNDSKR